MGRLWTKEEMEVLRKLADKGYNYKQIAEVLKDRTPTAVLNKMEDEGIKPKVETVIDYDAFRRMMGAA